MFVRASALLFREKEREREFSKATALSFFARLLLFNEEEEDKEEEEVNSFFRKNETLNILFKEGRRV